MNHNAYIYIFTAAIVSYLIRVIPLTIFRKPIKNRFIKSFLYYVPYVTLAIMTFPAIIQTTESYIPGLIALIVGIIISYFGAGLFPVACVCCAIVFITELFI
ncbi:MAG: AzlD domain-containing protein [Treponema sp.]|nr:AzlD domain-containing protein [Treponema sp.]